MPYRQRFISWFLFAGLLLTTAGAAEETDPEIEYLLSAVATSGCLFVRNGKEHPADEAESHLRMKYSRGSRYVSNADDFIKRIASKSSWTGKHYQIKCPDEDIQPSGQWLSNHLSSYRERLQPAD